MICFICWRYWAVVIVGGDGMIMRNEGWGGQSWWSVDAILNLVGNRPSRPESITDLLFLIQIQFGMVVAEFHQNPKDEVIDGGAVHFGDGIDDFLGFLVGHMRCWVGDKRLWNEGWGGQS